MKPSVHGQAKGRRCSRPLAPQWVSCSWEGLCLPLVISSLFINEQHYHYGSGTYQSSVLCSSPEGSVGMATPSLQLGKPKNSTFGCTSIRNCASWCEGWICREHRVSCILVVHPSQLLLCSQNNAGALCSGCGPTGGKTTQLPTAELRANPSS